ncbi:hypothetical protein NUU61_009131 [Penicillium alfredii]|uniref:Uncharacterized protein n=1 Tax=Penicillium alfredii TaxID=1506179 RepID=A0A9W9EMG3_9EURO|nr:uncharacterized protein NUU61_009131 [Penicillium alfredii]KAJ5084552.1 hypothetical protein NUU61_009131 [Penicillium alfredii]
MSKDWDDIEPDLDANDIDAQIERAHERIQDGIMPHIFENKLKNLNRRKKDRKKDRNEKRADRTGLTLLQLTFAIRIPGAKGYNEYEFIDDTGASLMLLFENDVCILPELSPYLQPPQLGSTVTHTANGRVKVKTIEPPSSTTMCQWCHGTQYSQ